MSVTTHAAHEDGALRRASLRALGLAFRLLGPLRMETTLDYWSRGAAGTVTHTTRFSKWGLTVLSSTETLHLEVPGPDLGLDGELRAWPLRWRRFGFGEARVTIEPDALGARYIFEPMGLPVEQRTRVVEDGLEISQDAGWWRATGLLRRTGPLGRSSSGDAD